MSRPSRLLVAAALASVYIVWGSTYLTIRFATESIPPLLMAGCRFLFAGVLMYAVARCLGAPRPTARHWRSSAIIGFCLLACGNGGVTVAEQWVTTGVAALFVATVPMFLVLFGWWSGVTRRPSGWTVFGLALGFGGIVTLAGSSLQGNIALNHGVYLGMGILICGSALWAGGSLYSKTAHVSPSPFLSAAMQMIAGGVMMLTLSAVIGEAARFHPYAVSQKSLLCFGYLVVFGSIVAFTAYIWLMRVCPPALVATYAYVNPAVAVMLGVVFGGETLSARLLQGGSLIVASVAIIITAQIRQGTQGSSAPPIKASLRKPLADVTPAAAGEVH